MIIWMLYWVYNSGPTHDEANIPRKMEHSVGLVTRRLQCFVCFPARETQNANLRRPKIIASKGIRIIHCANLLILWQKNTHPVPLLRIHFLPCFEKFHIPIGRYVRNIAQANNGGNIRILRALSFFCNGRYWSLLGFSGIYSTR